MGCWLCDSGVSAFCGNLGKDRKQAGGDMLKEFKEFAIRGNVVDLAVGIIVGSAFGKIVTSLVGDIIMPPIGTALGNVDFANLFVSLDPQRTSGITSLSKAKETGAPIIAYGSFINTVIDFVIVAFAIFFLVKLANRLKGEPAPTPIKTKECPQCLSIVPLMASRCAHCTQELK